ncbi:MAG: class I SAM-dependent methyltransferase, partial [Dehalococcoidales bacterium]
MKNYDAVAEERRWRQRETDTGKVPALPEKHYFVHNHVRSRLYEALVRLGCNGDSYILEIGCGSGEDSQYVGRVSRNLTGVDISQCALKSYVASGFSGILADAGKIPFAADSFDYVLFPATLHHLVGQSNLVDYVRESVRVVRPHGYVMALEPNLFNVSGMLMNIFNTIKPGITGLVPHE